jgi:ABC-type bacteriocin/lantibiotic exporter with double-glycine peptidase domain
MKGFFKDFFLFFRYLLSGRGVKSFNVVLLTFINSILELISIGAVIPFVGFLINPYAFQQNSYVRFFNENICCNLVTNIQFVTLVTLLFIALNIFSAISKFYVLRILTKFTFEIGNFLGVELYARSIAQPYKFYLNNRTSSLTSLLTTKATSVIYSSILPFFNLISSLLFLFLIFLCLVILINPFLVFIVCLVCFSIYFLAVFVSNRLLIRNSLHIARYSSETIKKIQEGLGFMKQIILNRMQNSFLKEFERDDSLLKKAMASNLFISSFPRIALESLIVLSSTLILFNLYLKNFSIISYVPYIAALAMVFQRLIPTMQQIFSAWANITGNKENFYEVLDFLKLGKQVEASSNEPLTFNSNINFENVYFRYDEYQKDILQNLNFSINKGDCLGIWGESGVGKSTFLDVLMGFLEPTEGFILIDNAKLNKNNIDSWRSKISYVPQDVYLLDLSIADNIAMGDGNVKKNFDRICQVINLSGLKDFVDGLPLGKDTIVGERAAFLSGGQKQRLAIARALYKDAEVIFFDEPTSSLDPQNEIKFLEAIEFLRSKYTLFIVSHRLDLLKCCNKVIHFTKRGVELLDAHEILIK